MMSLHTMIMITSGMAALGVFLIVRACMPDDAQVQNALRVTIRRGIRPSLVTAHARAASIGGAIAGVVLAGFLAGAFVYAQTPEIADRAPSRSAQAVQSAALVSALAGGAVTLWLSNRRRVIDEATLRNTEASLQNQREQSAAELALSRERTEEERFATAIALLGNTNASVRVGALHALQGLARTAPDKCQTVIDVMSAYLRQPFHHPDWGVHNQVPAPTDADPQLQELAHSDIREADREREVRRTALRLIGDLLPKTPAGEDPLGPDLPTYLVDLTGAHIDDLMLDGTILRLRAPNTHFHGQVWLKGAKFITADFSHARFYGRVSMDGTRFGGRARFYQSIFHSDAWFLGAAFNGYAEFNWAQFHEMANFSGAMFYRPTSMANARFHDMAIMDRAEFHNTASFRATVFIGYASFHGAEFRQVAQFEEAYFHTNLEFTRASLLHQVSFSSAHFHGLASFDDVVAGEKSELVFNSADFCNHLSLPDDFTEISAESVTVNGTRELRLPHGWTFRKCAATDLIAGSTA